LFHNTSNVWSVGLGACFHQGLDGLALTNSKKMQAFSLKPARLQYGASPTTVASAVTSSKAVGKEALRARSKYEGLKSSVEKLLNARSQNKQNIEAKVCIYSVY